MTIYALAVGRNAGVLKSDFRNHELLVVMLWGKIFISHSTKTAEARVFLDVLKQALTSHFKVLLDEEELEAGDDWREKIYEWIDDAHGAILLLTPEALKSKSVQIEASVLG